MDALSLLHWSFFAVSLLCSAISYAAKKIGMRYPKWRDSILLDGRVIPAMAGMIFGLIPGMPLPEAIKYGISSALYFGMAGILSTWIYSLLEKVFRDILPDAIKKRLK